MFWSRKTDTGAPLAPINVQPRGITEGNLTLAKALKISTASECWESILKIIYFIVTLLQKIEKHLYFQEEGNSK